MEELAPKRVRMEKSEKKMMTTVFWDHEGVLYTKYLEIDRKKNSYKSVRVGTLVRR